MHVGNRDYYRLRAKEERRKAEKAVGLAAKAHLDLAAKYEEMAAAARDID